MRLVVTGHPRGAVGICSLRGDWAERRSNRVGELVESGSELVDSSTFQDSFAADKAKPAFSVNQGEFKEVVSCTTEHSRGMSREINVAHGVLFADTEVDIAMSEAKLDITVRVLSVVPVLPHVEADHDDLSGEASCPFGSCPAALPAFKVVLLECRPSSRQKAFKKTLGANDLLGADGVQQRGAVLRMDVAADVLVGCRGAYHPKELKNCLGQVRCSIFFLHPGA